MPGIENPGPLIPQLHQVQMVRREDQRGGGVAGLDSPIIGPFPGPVSVEWWIEDFGDSANTNRATRAIAR